MKKLLIIILAIAIIACTCSCGKSTLYPETGVVVEIHDDIVVVETFTGNLFEFYGSEDWFVGDIASMIMDSCGTDVVTDDVIITAKYSGAWR